MLVFLDKVVDKGRSHPVDRPLELLLLRHVVKKKRSRSAPERERGVVKRKNLPQQPNVGSL